jgi:hypothetical protein
MTDTEVKEVHMKALSYLEHGRKIPAKLMARMNICNECEQPKREWYYLAQLSLVES